MTLNLCLRCLFWCNRKISDSPPQALTDEIASIRARSAEEGQESDPLLHSSSDTGIETETRIQEQDQEIRRLEADLIKLQQIIDEKEDTLRGYGKQFHKLRGENDARVQQLERDLQTCIAEKEDALTRLSQMVSIQVRDNNPNIVDLGDAFRPEKLAEMSNDIYDNAWFDALDDLPDAWSEQEKIAMLLEIVMRCFTFCNQLGQEQLDYVSKWMTSESDDNSKRTTKKMLKDSRKQKALNVLPVVEEGCFSNLKQETTVFYLETISTANNLQAYMRACVKLCWLLAVQDPPCVLVCPGWTPSRTDELTPEQYPQLIETQNCSEMINGRIRNDDDQALSTDDQAPSTDDQALSTDDQAPSTDDQALSTDDQAHSPDDQAQSPDEQALSLSNGNAHDVHRVVEGATAGERINFDKTRFNEYTQRGKYVDYVVWPYMLLHEGGQILGKGIAQGCDKP